MPRHRKARPFIDKKNAEHFVLMHRSQQDPRYYDEDASAYVLMSTRARFATPLYAGAERETDADSVGDAPEAEEDGDEEEDVCVDEDGDAEAEAMLAGAARGAPAPRGAAPPRGHTAGRPGPETEGRGLFTEDMYAAAEPRAEDGSRRSKGGKKRRRPMVRDVEVSGADARRGVHEVSEVDEYGFPLDGYDYSKHLREMGRGTYISAAGTVMAASVAATHTIAAKLDLPEDVLPCHPEEELDRMLEAISLRPETLPKDVRQALEAAEALNDDDRLSQAGMEELDDNFVLQAAGELDIPDAPGTSAGVAGSAGAAAAKEAEDFDFDAHIARLMKDSEGKWTDTADDFDADAGDEDGDYDDEDDEDEDEDDDEDDAIAARYRSRAAGAAAPAAGRMDDGVLATLLEQYEDDEIGALDDDDPRLRASGLDAISAAMRTTSGRNAVAHPDDGDEESDEEGADDAEDDDAASVDDEEARAADDGAAEPEFPAIMSRSQALDTMMQDYLDELEQDRVDSMLVTGVRPGSKTVRARTEPAPEPAESILARLRKQGDAGAPSAEPESTPRHAQAGTAPPASSSAFKVQLGGALGASTAAAAPATEKPVPFGFAEGDFKYDAVDDIPAMWEAKPKPKWDVETVVSTYTDTENHPKKLGAAVSITSSRTGYAAKALSAGAPPVIRLSKKTGLPIAAKPVRETIPEAPEAGAESEEADTSSEEGDGGMGGSVAATARVKGETPEQRRARKAAVKAERRERRENKKALKLAYTAEQCRQAHQARARDPLAGAVPM